MVNSLSDLLLGKCPADIPVGDLRDALKSYPQKESYTQVDVANIIEEAGKISPPKPQPKQKIVLDIEGGPRQEIECDQICNILEPYVKKARGLLLGSEDKKLAKSKVKKWIQNQLDHDREQGWYEAELKKAGRENIYPGQRRKRFFRLIKRNQKQVAQTLTSIVAKSGFAEDEVLLWILTDARPKLPKLQLTQSRKFPEGTRKRGYFSFNLRINTRDISLEEFLSVYKAIRGARKNKKSRVDPMHYRIVQLAQKEGGPPSDWNEDFWKKIKKKLERENKWDVPDTWNAIAKAYRKLVKHQ